MYNIYYICIICMTIYTPKFILCSNQFPGYALVCFLPVFEQTNILESSRSRFPALTSMDLL